MALKRQLFYGCQSGHLGNFRQLMNRLAARGEENALSAI